MANEEVGTALARTEESSTGYGVVHQGDPAMQFIATIQQRIQLAQMLVVSGLIPQRTPEQAMAVMLKGYELGIPPMAAFANIHPIPGKGGGIRLTMSADLMFAIASQRYGVKLKKVVSNTAQLAELVLSRPGWADTPGRFTIEEANKAALTGKDNWKSWPAAMLMARAKMIALRMICPEVGAGFYDPDEMGATTDESGAPVDAEWEFVPSEGAPQQSYGGDTDPSRVPEQQQSQPQRQQQSSGGGSTPPCPKCGGPMWDNTQRAEERKARGEKPGPQFKCKQKGGKPDCEGLYWLGEYHSTDELFAESMRYARKIVELGGKAEVVGLVERAKGDRDKLDGYRKRLRTEAEKMIKAAEKEAAKQQEPLPMDDRPPPEDEDPLDGMFDS